MLAFIHNQTLTLSSGNVYIDTGRQIPGAGQPCNSNLRQEGIGSAGSNITENGSFG